MPIPSPNATKPPAPGPGRPSRRPSLTSPPWEPISLGSSVAATLYLLHLNDYWPPTICPPYEWGVFHLFILKNQFWSCLLLVYYLRWLPLGFTIETVSTCFQALHGLALAYLSSSIFPDTPSPSVPQSCKPSSSKPCTRPSFCPTRIILLILGTAASSDCPLFCGLRAQCVSPLYQSCNFTSVRATIMPVSFTKL